VAEAGTRVWEPGVPARIAGQSLVAAATVLEHLRGAVEGLAIPHRTTSLSGVVTVGVGVAALMPEEGRHSSLPRGEFGTQPGLRGRGFEGITLVDQGR